MKTLRQIKCPKCTAVLEVPLDANGVTCTTCDKNIRITVKPKVGSPVQSSSTGSIVTQQQQFTKNIVAKQIPPRMPKTSPKPLRFISYIWNYYTSTRWPLWMWTPLSIIVCITAYYFKSTLGVDNLKFLAIAAASVSAITFVGFCLRRGIRANANFR